MASVTVVGPMGTQQINDVFYVSDDGFATIQAAVNYARTFNSGTGEIVIVQGYPATELIPGITGGAAGIYLSDQRNGQMQNYVWNGSQYVASDFVQQRGFVSLGMPARPPASLLTAFDPLGNGGNGTGNIIATANPGKGMPALNLSGQAQDGGTLHIFMRCDNDSVGNQRVQVPSTMEITTVLATDPNPPLYQMWIGNNRDVTGAKGMSVWARPSEDAIDLQGETISGIHDQTIRLNYLGGDVLIGKNVGVSEAGELIAEDASFTTCEVDGSEVVTVATIGIFGGMIWPTPGIAVSATDHWAASIDPATVVIMDVNGDAAVTGTMTMHDASVPGTLNAGVVSSYNAVFINLVNGKDGAFSGALTVGGLNVATYPPIGIGVSTGSAWDVSINPADVPRLSTANTFAADQTMGNVLVTAHGHLRILPGSLGQNTGSPNINADAASLAINTAAGGNLFLNWNQGSSVIFGDGGQHNVGQVDSAGNAIFAGSVTCAVISASNSGSATTGIITALQPNLAAGNTTSINVGTANSQGKIVALGYKDGHGTIGMIAGGITTFDFPGNWTFAGAVTAPTLTAPIINNTSGNLRIEAPAGTPLYLNYASGSSVQFCNGSGAVVATVYANGNANFTGTLTAAGKSFLVPHPLDETKDLIHACLEGPENGVFYRGEAVVVDGYAEVTLPDYFEALTFPDDRSVQLTQIFEGSPLFARMAASRIVDGKFIIHATEEVTVAWEVKAVRRIGTDRLEVVRDKMTLPTFENAAAQAAQQEASA